MEESDVTTVSFTHAHTEGPRYRSAFGDAGGFGGGGDMVVVVVGLVSWLVSWCFKRRVSHQTAY